MTHIYLCLLINYRLNLKKVIDIVLHVLKILKFNNYTAQISLRDKDDFSKYIGSEENWDLAESAIIDSTKNKKS